MLVPRALAAGISGGASSLWATAFYALIFLLGLGSQAITVEGVVLALEDVLFGKDSNSAGRKFCVKRRAATLAAVTAMACIANRGSVWLGAGGKG